MRTAVRTYYKDRTESLMELPDGQVISILERPWLDNEPFVSCIKEGVYKVKRDHTGKHRWYKLMDVEGRTFIEIHPVNFVYELEGCLGPCMFIKNGVAHDSVEACQLLLAWFGEDDWLLEIRS